MQVTMPLKIPSFLCFEATQGIPSGVSHAGDCSVLVAPTYQYYFDANVEICSAAAVNSAVD